MNINIYIENALGKQLQEVAKSLHKSRNSIIREAIQTWIAQHRAHEWPPCIQSFKGLSEKKIACFESHRKDLTDPKDDPFQ